MKKNISKCLNKIKPYIAEAYAIVEKGFGLKKEILFEGAQGVFLDNDWGTYPFVTASTVLSGGITAGAGIPPQKIDKIIGVAKAYTTRVGCRTFPNRAF